MRDMLTADRKLTRNQGIADVKLSVKNSNPVKIDILVVDSKLLGFNILLKIDIIKKLGGVHINKLSEVRFFNPPIYVAIKINEPVFGAEFNQHTKFWTASWKWLDRHKLKSWLKNGWLIPYPEKEFGWPKGLILLMAGIQTNKGKLCPMLDFQELNAYVDT